MLHSYVIYLLLTVLSLYFRFTTFEDKDWFVANFWKVAAQELPDLVSEFPEGETFFVNFLREPVDPTGDEDEDFSTEAPKIYEELPSYVYINIYINSTLNLFFCTLTF